MAPNRGHNRSKELEALAESGSQADFDPEGDEISPASQESDASAGSAGEDHGGREHYVDVGKSKLRKPRTAPLGPQYRGSRVSRDDVEDEDEDEDDPFAKGFDDEESDEDDADGMELDGMSGSSVDDDDEDDEEDDAEDGEDGARARPLPNSMASAAQRAELMKETQKTVASTLSQSVKAEAEKGRAVKKQRATFDALLGARIKLQKSLVATNTISGLDEDDLAAQRGEAHDAIEAAESAAFNLWSQLNDFREELHAMRTGEKRKRSAFDSHSPDEKLWAHMEEREEANLPHRNATLQRWSNKTKEETIRAQGALVNKSTQTPIIDSLQQYLTGSSTHLLNKAHTPRSCAPLQASRKLETDPRIYDDADFYGLLLKELLESKSSGVASAVVDVDFDPRREAKAKKHVDTKASKGRKLRYTVHEKLQNFMAPEDRRRWGERQADELFGSLFGRRLAGLGLGEDEVDGDGDGELDEREGAMEDGVDGGTEGLMLFRK